MNEASRRITARRTAIAWTLVALLVIAGLWNASRYAWLCDDAFIAFRYARHLVRGHGLVYNVGEHVEGYTSLAWVLELAALRGVLRVRPEDAVQTLSLAYTAATLVLTAQAARLVAPRAWRELAMVVAVAFLALHRSFAVWGTGGLETRQHTFFLLLGAVLAWRPPRARWGLWPAALAFSMAVLTRPETPLFLASFTAVLALDRRRIRTRRARSELVTLVALPASVYLAQLAFRLAYYGDWVPNTFRAKQEWLPEFGALYLRTCALETGLYVLVPLVLAGAITRWRRGDPRLLALLSPLAPHLLYVMTLGGDHFEWRPLDPWWPPIAIAIVPSVVMLSRTVASPRARALVSVGAASSILACGLLAQAIVGIEAERCVSRRTCSDPIADTLTPERHPTLYAIPGLAPAIDLYRRDLRALLRRFSGARREQIVFATRGFDVLLGALRKLDGPGLPSDLVMSEAAAGAIPYAAGDLTVVDELGLTDRVIARSRNSDDWIVTIAHNRVPPPGYLESREAFLQPMHTTSSEGDALWSAVCAFRASPTLYVPLHTVRPLRVIEGPPPEVWTPSAEENDEVERRRAWLLSHLRGRAATCVDHEHATHVLIDGRAMTLARRLGWRGASRAPVPLRRRTALDERHFGPVVIEDRPRGLARSEEVPGADGRWLLAYVAATEGTISLVCDGEILETERISRDGILDLVRRRTPRAAHGCSLALRHEEGRVLLGEVLVVDPSSDVGHGQSGSTGSGQ